MSEELQLLDNRHASAVAVCATDTDDRAPCGSFSQNRRVIKLGHGGKRPGAGRKPVAIPERQNEPRWYCVRTLWGQDIRADIQIRLGGFEVFAPTLWKPPVVARRMPNGSMRPARDAVIKPLFPRYLFAKFNVAEPDWRAIRGMPGVDEILSAHPEAPLPVPESALEAVRSLCAPNDCVYPPGWSWSHQAPVQTPLQAGCRLRVLYGPLADHIGICQISDGKRVQLLLEILSRAVTVKVAQADVEVA